MKEKFEQEQKDRQNHIEDLMTDMPDMEDDKKFRQWLEETYINEAELIEKSLLAGREYEKNLDIAEELSVPREKFYQRLKEEGLYEDEADKPDENSDVSKITENDDSIPKTAGDKIISVEERRPVRKKRSYLRLGKVAGVAGVCLLCVFAASMTSEANRNYWVRGFKYLTGNDTKVISDNDENNEIANMDEDKAIQDIEDKIGVEVPEFYYRPYNMQFLKYEVSERTSVAKVEYQYGENIILFVIDKQNANTASDIKSTHGEKKKEIVISGDNVEITVEKVTDAGEKRANYVAQWSRDNTNYVFSGRLEWDELKKMLEQMKF